MTKIEAKLRQMEIAKKNKNIQAKMQDGGLGSQWAKMTAENKLIQRNHFMKAGARARQDFLRDQKRKLKALNGTKLVVIKK